MGLDEKLVIAADGEQVCLTGLQWLGAFVLFLLLDRRMHPPGFVLACLEEIDEVAVLKSLDEGDLPAAPDPQVESLRGLGARNLARATTARP